MQQIRDWLDALGLGQYAQRFAANGIDLEVLPDLTDQDLERLGVLLGHRRKLQRAIAARGVTSGATPETTLGVTLGTAPGPDRPEASQPDNEQEAERRQLTVLFGDLVGSTALSARLDPEDLRRVYRAYRDTCVQEVARYDGHVAQFMGDGVMVYFGYPRAHEDDAERAVRAGLAIVTAVGALRTPVDGRIEVRVGIATGLVVAGNLSVPGQAAIGETPNLAARLQAAAAPGSVVVAASTRRLLGELFRLRPLGNLMVKGIADSVEAWAVEGETPSESRFEMVRARRLTRFVGREREVAVLDDRHRQAWAGAGQIVLILGEAGIGKSRFAARFAERIADQPHTRLSFQCSPYHTASAFYPVIGHLRRAAGLDPADPPEQQLEKLETLIGLATSRVEEVAPLFAALLSLPTGERYPPSGLGVAERRQRTITALVDQLEGLARKQPLLVLFEDAHWADASSLEVLSLVVERLHGLPLLALVTSRPEFTPAWAGMANTTTLTLGRLDQADVRAMIEQVSAGKPPPDEVAEQIIAKADGVPLFVEELTKTVLESGLLVEETGRYRLDGPLLPLAVPATLQDSLMARLDRLAPVKEIAAIGALIGREFSYALLQRVADRDRETLDSALTQLEAAELLFRTGSPPDFRYRFKHALVQDAAYESLLRSRRQILHRRIAEVLQDAFAAQVSTEPEVVAHHYGQAGLTELAVDWWTKAGDRAANRSAVIEAVAHYSRAIALSDSAPTAPVRRQTRLRLQINYGQTLAAAHGPGALETIAAFARARDLAEAVEDPTERRSLRAGLWTNSFVHGDIAAARQIAADFQIEAATRQGSPEYCIAHRVLGATACLEGELTLARMHLERAVTAYDPTRDTAVQSPYGHDLGVITMGHLAAVLWQLGEIDAGRACVADTLRIAIGSQHLATMIYGYFYKSLFEAQAMRADRVTPSARAMFDLCNEHFQQSGWLAGANFMLGWADCEAGEHARGLATMRRAIGFFREQEVTTYPIFYRGILGYTEARAGQVESGLATVEEALADSERIGLRWFLSELGRLRGEILLMLPRPRTDAAEAAFTRALDIARAQAARSYELRAALGLAKLYEITGRERLIRDLLSQVSSTFRPDPDFVELEQARRLLARLD